MTVSEGRGSSGCLTWMFLSCPQAAEASRPLVCLMLTGIPAASRASEKAVTVFRSGRLYGVSSTGFQGIKFTCDLALCFFSRDANSFA